MRVSAIKGSKRARKRALRYHVYLNGVSVNEEARRWLLAHADRPIP
jgi:hypothetical protein